MKRKNFFLRSAGFIVFAFLRMRVGLLQRPVALAASAMISVQPETLLCLALFEPTATTVPSAFRPIVWNAPQARGTHGEVRSADAPSACRGAAEDMTDAWREYYLEALWRGEDCGCEIPRGKCTYWLIIAGKV